MKIAFTTSGETLDSPLEGRFGRSPRFLVYDLARDTFEMVDNAQSVNTPQGAGIQAAETVARTGASCVVTGNCGPKAFRVLAAAGIRVYRTDAPNVGAALENYRYGRLTEAGSAVVKGHWAFPKPSSGTGRSA